MSPWVGGTSVRGMSKVSAVSVLTNPKVTQNQGGKPPDRKWGGIKSKHTLDNEGTPNSYGMAPLCCSSPRGWEAGACVPWLSRSAAVAAPDLAAATADDFATALGPRLTTFRAVCAADCTAASEVCARLSASSP